MELGLAVGLGIGLTELVATLGPTHRRCFGAVTRRWLPDLELFVAEGGDQTELPAEGAPLVTVAAPAVQAEADADAETADGKSPLETGKKALNNIKKFVYSGLAQVSKIAQPSSTATPAPENTPHIETTASNGGRKTRSTLKKAKSSDPAGDI